MVVTELTDAELLDRARNGDEAAFTALYRRHHPAIHRLAASYLRHEADDLVDAAFAQVVAELRRRSGPTEAFRAYLFATVHAEVVDRLSDSPAEPLFGPAAGPVLDAPAGPVSELAAEPLFGPAADATPAPPAAEPLFGPADDPGFEPADDPGFEPVVDWPGRPGVDGTGVDGGDRGRWPAVPGPVAAVAGYPALGGSDRVMITRAFESLPDRWQVPVWHTTVLGGDVADLSRALDVPRSVAAPLVRYAATKLRQAYLQAHLDAAPRPACEPHRPRLTAHVRGALDPEASDGVRDHLSRCDSCRDLVAALDTVDELLARSVVPFFPAASVSATGGVPRPLGLSGSVAVVEVTGDTPTVAAEAAGDPPAGSRWQRLLKRPATKAPSAADGDARQARRHPDGASGDEADAQRGMAAGRRARRPAANIAGAAGAGLDQAEDGDSRRSKPAAWRGRGFGGGAAAGHDSNEDDGDSGDGETDGRGGWRSRRPAATVGGAAAATVLVAGLAVFGTAMARDDGDGGSDEALTGDIDDADDYGRDDSGDRGTGGNGRRAPGGKDDAGPTTTVPGDDEDPEPDDADAETLPQRPVSSVRSATGEASPDRPAPAPPRGSDTPAPGPTTTAPSPTTTVPPDPDPDPALASWTVGWSAGSSTGGTLSVTVSSPAGPDPVETAPVIVTIDLSAGAHAGSLGGGCQSAGQRVTCTVPAPAAGDSTSVAVGLTVDGPGETATVSARQDGTALGGAQTVSLDVPEAMEAAS